MKNDLACLVLGVAVIALQHADTSAQEAPTIVSDLSYITPSRLVDIGGRKMNLHCTGTGSPTVILDAGLGDQIAAWAMVQPVVEKKTKVCSYDRAGLGFSDASGRPATSANIADDLHNLLNAASVKPPFVLVGHSAGGMYVRMYADLHSTDVVGMVLVDPVSENQGPRYFELDPTMRSQNLAYVNSIRDECIPAATHGFKKHPTLQEKCLGGADPRFSDAFNQALLANQTRPAFFQSGVSEWDNVFTVSSDQVRANKGSYGVKPLIVLTRAPFPKSATETQQMRDDKNRLWMTLHDEIAGLSTRGENQVIHGAGHYIQLEQPTVVITAILRVLQDSAASGKSKTDR